ncbi:MAG: methyltransferase, FkbM family domain protein [Flavipsychrobacter sp.]|nr:methyltransferase, FkbM family domain protein [Flavipsychrobacter sp.]
MCFIPEMIIVYSYNHRIVYFYAMSLTFYKELAALNRAKSITSLLPEKARLRVAKKLYDYQSASIHGIDMVVPLQNDGLVCFINTKDLIGWKIFFTGEYERGTNRVLEQYVKEGDIVIEAGANLGSETVLLSKMVGKGRVYGFEPNPYTFDRLKTNVAINELTNVEVFDIAMGEKNGSISFNIYPKNFCNAGMSSKYMETPLTRKITVQQQTLDSFVKAHNISKVDFLKMDIQGAEMDLLKGAGETMAKYKPKVFLEALEVYNDVKAMYEELKKYGYTVHNISDEGTTPMNTLADVKEGNWLALYNK